MKNILFYVLLCIVSPDENAKKCNNRIKFKIKDVFYARNGDLFSLSHEHKELISDVQMAYTKNANQTCLRNMQEVLNRPNSVMSHFLCLLEHKRIGEIICLLSSDKHQ